jgi:hypothetical protein
MHLSFDGWSLRLAALVLTTAVACGGRSEDPGDGGTGAATGGTSSTGGGAGSGATGGQGGASGGGTGGTSSTGGAGGSGGTGGTGATGGVGGSGGNGGTGGIITPGDSGTCGCVTGHVGWGWDGGHVQSHDASALEVCNLFLHQRTPVSQDPPAVSCEQQMTNCAGVFTPGDVTRAIMNADVKAALAAAPVLYGEDPRPYDGQVLRIQIGSAIIEVGVACRVAGCKPVPDGVAALANLLQAITKQELSRAPCSMIFPPLP